MKNEKTGPMAAAIAGRILERLKYFIDDGDIGYGWSEQNGVDNQTLCFTRIMSVKELEAVCASALTQAPDRPAKKKR